MRATLRLERSESERLDLTMDGPHLAYARGRAGDARASVRVKKYASVDEAEAAYRTMVSEALERGFVPAAPSETALPACDPEP